MSEWTDHVARWKDCTACPLCSQRDRICLARGTVPADIVFIGEAPGATEDAIGQPFVGPAGKLLDQIIEHSLPPERSLCGDCDADVTPLISDNRYGGCPRCLSFKVRMQRSVSYALTNLVCCFPRDAKAEGINLPERGEILACKPRLREFINLARPRLIVCVGGLATQYVDHGSTVPCADIVHPAWLLRLKLAQKQQEIQRCVVLLRSAVEDMLAAPWSEWKEWGGANLTEGRGLRQRLDAWQGPLRDFDIPF